MINKRLISGFLALYFVSIGFQTAAAAAPAPIIIAETAILMDAETGKVLYGKDEHKRMFPASTTKILTALVALDYLRPEELIVIGSEIHNASMDSSRAGHIVGESILVENLIRALMLPSGSETSCVVALEVAKRATSNKELSYSNAEKIFADLMNKKAESLGAHNSSFVNPHGLHNPNHFTSAFDMALISNEVMKNDVFRKVVGEGAFNGNGAGLTPTDDSEEATTEETAEGDILTQDYTWYNRNLLLFDPTYSYPYTTGIKTGFTDEAGDSLAASAKKNDKELIAVVFNATDPARWLDSAALFDYGFDNFNYELIQESDIVLDSIELQNYKLSEESTLELITNEEFGDIFSREQVNAIQHEIVFHSDFVVKNEETDDDTIRLKAPIAKGDTVAKITYTLHDTVLFEGDLLASRDVEERTLRSDFDYYLAEFQSLAFSWLAIPFWLAGLAVIFVIAKIISFFNNRRNNHYRRIRRRY